MTSLITRLDHCNTCFAPEGAGGSKLRKCASCKNATYCSKECQTQAWKSHKAMCQQVTDLRERALQGEHVSPREEDMLEGMPGFKSAPGAAYEEWITIWKSQICEASVTALDLVNYPDRNTTHNVAIYVEHNSEASEAKHAFKMTRGEIYSFDEWVQTLHDMSFSPDFIEDWKRHRLGATGPLRIIIIWKKYLRFLSFTVVTHGLPINRTPTGSRLAAKRWAASLQSKIEQGDTASTSFTMNRKKVKKMMK